MEEMNNDRWRNPNNLVRTNITLTWLPSGSSTEDDEGIVWV